MVTMENTGVEGIKFKLSNLYLTIHELVVDCNYGHFPIPMDSIAYGKPACS